MAGCILSSGVKVGPSVDLKQLRLQSTPLDDLLGSDEIDSTTDAAKFGAHSVAFEYTEDEDSDGDSEDSDEQVLIEERWGIDEEKLSEGFCSQEDEADDDDDEADEDENDGGTFYATLFKLSTKWAKNR